MSFLMLYTLYVVSGWPSYMLFAHSADIELGPGNRKAAKIFVFFLSFISGPFMVIAGLLNYLFITKKR